jgi:hypothetical protein
MNLKLGNDFAITHYSKTESATVTTGEPKVTRRGIGTFVENIFRVKRGVLSTPNAEESRTRATIYKAQELRCGLTAEDLDANLPIN